MKKIMIFAFSMFVLNQQAQTPLNSNLVVCMPMNNSPLDFSGNSNNGTPINGGPTGTTDRNGNANSAYLFSAASQQYLRIPPSPSINNIEANDELSICVWANVYGWGANTNGVFPMVEKYDTPVTDVGWVFFLQNNPSTGKNFLANNSPLMLSTSGAIPLGGLSPAQWHFYVMTFSSASNLYQLFVDGVLVTSTPLTPAGAQLLNTTGDMLIGCSLDSSDDWADGAMDDLRIYNRVISQQDVTDLYKLPSLTCASTSTVPPPPSCCLGNSCGQSLNNLSGAYQIPQNGFNFNFTTPQASNGQVLIGRSACATTSARLDVFNDNFATGIKGYSSIGATHIGIHGQVLDPATNNGIASIGVLGQTGARVPANKSAAIAGFCGGNPNYALIPTGQNVAVYGNSISNFGVFAGYFDGDVRINGAVAPVSNSNPNAGPGPGLYALTVNGNAVTTAGAWYLSDKRFKDNIKPLDDVMTKIKKLNGYNYTYRTDDYKDKNFNSGNQIGLIAQELKEVYPELVREDKDGYLAVNYQGLIPVMLEAIKSQQTQIDNLTTTVAQQKTMIDALINKAGASTGINEMNTVPSGFNMDQNVPNPFNNETVINYTLPNTVSSASLVVYDLSGKQVTSFPLTDKGSSSITLTSEKLAAGIYLYSIMADGKIVDTKRMVVANK